MKQETLEVVVLHQDGVDVYREGLRAILKRLGSDKIVPANVAKNPDRMFIPSISTESKTVFEYNEDQPPGLEGNRLSTEVVSPRQQVTVFRVLCDVPE